jgi:ABC-2 type transport system permease protein
MRWLLAVYRSHFHNAVQLRVAFLLDILGMMFGNACILLAYYFALDAFQGVGGWTGRESMLLNGITSLGFGLAYSLSGGAEHLQGVIQRGELDAYILRPRNLLLQLLTSSFWPAVIGDLLFGLIIIFIYAFLAKLSVLAIVLVLLSAIPSALVLVSMSVIIGSYAFWRPDDHSVSNSLFSLFLNPSFFPVSGFSFWPKVFFTVAVPSLLIGGWQVEWLLHRLWYIYPALFLLSFVWVLIAVSVFYLGLRRYEGVAAR